MFAAPDADLTPLAPSTLPVSDKPVTLNFSMKAKPAALSSSTAHKPIALSMGDGEDGDGEEEEEKIDPKGTSKYGTS